MNPNLQTSKAYFKFLTIIYFALITGQLIFGLFAYYLNSNNITVTSNPELREIFLYVVPMLFLFSMLAGYLIFRFRIRMIKARTTLVEKLTQYRSLVIVRYALLEGSSLFSIVAYLVTGDLLFLTFSGFIILFFISIRPTRERAETELRLNSSEMATINDPEAYVADLFAER